MYVFELTQPGVSLEGILDDQERYDAEALLRLLVSCIEDAAVSLSLFEFTQSEPRHRESQLVVWEANRDRVQEIVHSYLAKLSTELSERERIMATFQIQERASIEARRERWERGDLPDSYRGRLPLMHAKSCLYALDTLQKTLKLLTKMKSPPQEVHQALADFRDAFPTLNGVRDSSHHAEDRVQGKKYQAPIVLLPVAIGPVHSPAGGALVFGALDCNRFGGTLGDGTYGVVEISRASVAIAQQIVQSTLNAFKWWGPVSYFPN